MNENIDRYVRCVNCLKEYKELKHDDFYCSNECKEIDENWVEDIEDYWEEESEE